MRQYLNHLAQVFDLLWLNKQLLLLQLSTPCKSQIDVETCFLFVE